VDIQYMIVCGYPQGVSLQVLWLNSMALGFNLTLKFRYGGTKVPLPKFIF